MVEDPKPAAAPNAGAAPAGQVSSAGTPGGVDGNPSPSGGADWRAQFTGDLRRAAEKFSSPADVVRSYAELQKRLGRSVTLPGKDASAHERDAFYARLGRPSAPEGYGNPVPANLPAHLKPGPGAEASHADFLRAMHQAGATPEAVHAASGWFYRTLADDDRAKREDQATARDEAEAVMRREWRDDYDGNLERARRAARHYGGDELAQMMDANGFGNHPAWLRAFAHIGREMAEDGLLTGVGSDQRAGAQERIDRIMADHFGKPSYDGAGVQAELRQLFEEIYGTGPARPDAA